ncbi:MAG: adenosylcobinamide-phosphate synthase CbiB [Hyphomonas sp.]
MAGALAVEAAFGWPDWLYRRIRHPVVWIGALISALERRLNRPGFSHPMRYALGAFTSLLTIAATTGAAVALACLIPNTLWGAALEMLLASSLLASRSLYAHVAAIAAPLQVGDLALARQNVSMIVGRDPAQLDASAIARAGLESLAENASDGVIAPLFWGALLGLPGIAAYKAINTLDSMIGHRSERYAAFGGFAARLDDAANFIPARLTGLLIALPAWRTNALSTMLRDARRHRSPNAGWPEAAMAGALGVRLSGPRQYGSHVSDEPWLNPSAPDPNADQMWPGLSLFVLAVALAGIILAGIGTVWSLA